MRCFKLNRIKDETGVSGTGIIAEGVEFTNGTCALVWLTEVHSTIAVYTSIDVLVQIHGHDGATIVEWVDFTKAASMGAMREVLANLCHRQRSDWMKYLFSRGGFDGNGRWIMPPKAVERWQRQMDTPYSDLSKDEQNSDRNEADKFLAVIRDMY